MPHLLFGVVFSKMLRSIFQFRCSIFDLYKAGVIKSED